MPDEQWDPERTSRSLAYMADESERYVRENLGRIRRRDPRADAAQMMVDQSSGEAAVARILSTSRALLSRDEFVREVKRLEQQPGEPSPGSMVRSREMYQLGWVGRCRQLLGPNAR